MRFKGIWLGVKGLYVQDSLDGAWNCHSAEAGKQREFVISGSVLGILAILNSNFVKGTTKFLVCSLQILYAMFLSL